MEIVLNVNVVSFIYPSILKSVVILNGTQLVYYNSLLLQYGKSTMHQVNIFVNTYLQH